MDALLWTMEFVARWVPTGTVVDDSTTEGNLPNGSGDNGMGDGGSKSLSCFEGGIGG